MTTTTPGLPLEMLGDTKQKGSSRCAALPLVQLFICSDTQSLWYSSYPLQCNYNKNRKSPRRIADTRDLQKLEGI